MDSWPFWMMEENIKIANELVAEEEAKNVKNESEQQMPNLNMNGIMNTMNSMTNKFK